MKKLLLVLLSLVFLFTPFAYASTPSSVQSHAIVIDAGHGGTDIGSGECSLLEKEVTLDIAYKLKTLLEANNADVYMTRIDDSTLSNNDRYTFANEKKGEAFVSIHLNGSTNHNANGTLGLYGKRGKDKDFTTVMHDRLASELSVPDQGITNFASGVLLKSKMPATIQETVFISNTDECNALVNGGGARQQEIADALFRGLEDWFSQAPPDDDVKGGGPPPGKGKPN